MVDPYFKQYKERLEGKLVCLAHECMAEGTPSAGLVTEVIPELHKYEKKSIHRAGAKVLWSNNTVCWVTCSSLMVHPDVTADT